MTLTLSSSADATSSVDAPERVIVSSPSIHAGESTSTLGGLAAAPTWTSDNDRELQSWAEIARRARERWGKENPY